MCRIGTSSLKTSSAPWMAVGASTYYTLVSHISVFSKTSSRTIAPFEGWHPRTNLHEDLPHVHACHEMARELCPDDKVSDVSNNPFNQPTFNT